AITLAPWARWSGISGTVFNALEQEITPGRFVEWGIEIGYYLKVMPDLTLGTSVLARQRLFYQTKIAGEHREDKYLSPGFSATRTNILSCACDLLLDYRYRINNSNDPGADYRGHRVSLSFASRF